MASLLYAISTAEGGLAACSRTWSCCRATASKRHRHSAARVRHRQKPRKQGVLRLTLLTDMQNKRAQALYRKLGFVGSTMKPMRLKL